MFPHRKFQLHYNIYCDCDLLNTNHYHCVKNPKLLSEMHTIHNKIFERGNIFNF